MPRWPLLLPPLAVSTLPSRSRLPRRPSSSSHHRAVPHRQVAVAPSTAIAPHRPSPSIHHHAGPHRPSVVLSVYRRRTRAVPCRRGAVTLSIIAVEEPSRRPLPSRSRRAVHCCRGAVAPYLAIKEPSAVSTDDSGHSSRPSQVVVAFPLLTPPPPICRRLSLRHRLSCLLSVRLVFASPCFSRPHLSAGASASCHTPLGPLVRLVKASHLLMPPPPICGIT